MAFLRYTLLRVLLFLVVAALLWIVGIRGVWLVMFAILGSGIISVFALSRSRDAASVALANRMSTIKSRMAERTAAEDAWDDRQRAISEDGGMTGNTVGKEPGAAQQGTAEPQEPVVDIDTSSSKAPGRDLSDLEADAEVTHLRDEA
jgi:hypothetical protein